MLCPGLEVFKDYALYLDDAKAPAIEGTFRNGHGPQPITLPAPARARSVRLEFRFDHKGDWPGAAEDLLCRFTNLSLDYRYAYYPSHDLVRIHLPKPPAAATVRSGKALGSGSRTWWCLPSRRWRPTAKARWCAACCGLTRTARPASGGRSSARAASCSPHRCGSKWPRRPRACGRRTADADRRSHTDPRSRRGRLAGRPALGDDPLRLRLRRDADDHARSGIDRDWINDRRFDHPGGGNWYEIEPVPSRINMLLFYHQKMLETFADGIYWDNFCCRRTTHPPRRAGSAPDR